MATKKMAFPPEIIAQQRRRRARMLRLYGIGVAALVLVIAAILFGYGAFTSNTVSTSQRFASAVTAAQAAYVRGNYAEAERQLRVAIAIRDSYHMRFDLGSVLLKAGQYGAALDELRRAEAFDRVSSAYMYGALAALKLHRPDVALAQARQAVALDPTDGGIHGIMALVDQALGRAGAAQQELALARRDGYTPQTVQQWIAHIGFENGTRIAAS